MSTPANLNENTDDLPRKHPLEEHIEADRVLIARRVEAQLIEAGIHPRMARAAVVNAYAESGLNPFAVGDHGMSVGIFQLRTGGLGHKMTVEQRMNVRKSTARVARAVLKDESLMKMQRDCASLSDMVKAFTIRIERPKDAKRKARQRAEMSESFHGDVTIECKVES